MNKYVNQSVWVHPIALLIAFLHCRISELRTSSSTLGVYVTSFRLSESLISLNDICCEPMAEAKAAPKPLKSLV